MIFQYLKNLHLNTFDVVRLITTGWKCLQNQIVVKKSLNLRKIKILNCLRIGTRNIAMFFTVVQPYCKRIVHLPHKGRSLGRVNMILQYNDDQLFSNCINHPHNAHKLTSRPQSSTISCYNTLCTEYKPRVFK